MSQQRLIALHSARRKLESLKEVEKQFIQLCENSKIHDVPGSLKIDSDTATAEGLDFLATAERRYVRHEEGQFVVEYVFTVPFRDDKVEVCRIYLTNGGEVLAKLNPVEKLCDSDNLYVAKEILLEVQMGILQSAVFSPLESKSSQK
jgi:hypothetical protein